MTLRQVLNYINQALNFPSIDYTDVDVYFNMAIAELNTTLHTSIPTFSNQIETFKRLTSKDIYKMVLEYDPSVENVTILSVSEGESIPSGVTFYYNNSDNCFYKKTGNKFTNVGSEVEAIYTRGEPKRFITVRYASQAYWAPVTKEDETAFELSHYLPDDWVLLWLVPYVCFKYTVRDGGTAQVFADELTQGFQQLQETYNVPSAVLLATCAHKLAYRETVTQNLNNLNIMVPTMAIYEDMKHARSSNAVYGSMFDKGGFGL